MNIYSVLRIMNTYTYLALKGFILCVSVSFAEGFHWIGLTPPRDETHLREANFKWLWLDGSDVADNVTNHGDRNNNACAGLGIIMAKSQICQSQHYFICQRGKHVVPEWL